LIVEKETVGRVVIDEEFSLGKLSRQFISIPRKKVTTATVTIISVVREYYRDPVLTKGSVNDEYQRIQNSG
jgi:hypothetical protein